MADTWITPEMQALTGVELASQTSLPIDASDIRRWAIAIYFPTPPPRRYWDESFAATTHFGGLVAPEEFNPFAWITAAGPPERAETFEVGRAAPSVEESVDVEPPATHFMLNGGLEVTYGVRMRPGDVITSVSRHGGYSEREGRLGLMLFTYTDTEWTNQRGEWVKSVRGTGIRYWFEERMAVDIAVGTEIPVFVREAGLHAWNRYAAVNDEFVPIHMDDDAGRASGYDGAFGMGNLQFAWLHCLLRQWVEDADGRIVRVRCDFRAPSLKGHTVTAHGVVTEVRDEGDEQLVDLDVWTDTEEGTRLAPGSATVAFPR